jgi:hypothetical protein
MKTFTVRVIFHGTIEAENRERLEDKLAVALNQGWAVEMFGEPYDGAEIKLEEIDIQEED